MFGAAELARANGNIMTVGLFARRWDGTGVLKKAFYKGSAAYWEIRTALSVHVYSEKPFAPYLW